MEFQLRACQWCHGIKGAPAGPCLGCGQWILLCEHNGLRFGGPLDAETQTIVPWVGKPTAAQVEAEKASMLNLIAPPLIAQAIVDAITS